MTDLIVLAAVVAVWIVASHRLWLWLTERVHPCGCLPVTLIFASNSGYLALFFIAVAGIRRAAGWTE